MSASKDKSIETVLVKGKKGCSDMWETRQNGVVIDRQPAPDITNAGYAEKTRTQDLYAFAARGIN